MEVNRVLIGHVLETLRGLPDESVHMACTSPPYFGLRVYGTDPVYWPEITFTPMIGLPSLTIPEQYENLGLESDPWAYVGHLVAIFREVRRALRKDGTFWLNLDDSFSKNKYKIPQKNMVGIPWMVAKALQADDWYLRCDMIWQKSNGMPFSGKDRPTRSHEYIFLFSKSKKYFYDQEAVKVPPSDSTIGRGPVDFGGAKGRNYKPDKDDPNYRNGNEQWGRTYEYNNEGCNLRSVWKFSTNPYPEAHYAVWPPKLAELMILAGTSDYGVCPKCKAPWKRVIEKETEFRSGSGKAGNVPDGKYKGTEQATSGQYDIRMGPVNKTKTTGWQPTCSCGLTEVEPAIVLDPFLGSGTTAKVAIANRRDWLGCELNEMYATDLVKGRVNGTQVSFINMV